MKHLTAFFIALCIFLPSAHAQQQVAPCVSSYSSITGAWGCQNVTATFGLPVNIVAGGGAGGTSSNFGATFPTAGTAAGASDGTNMQPLLVDGSGNLKVNVITGGGGGSTFDAAFPSTGVAAGLSDGTNMKAWLAAIALGDGVNGNNTAAVAPWWWNGTTYDRTSPLGLKSDAAAGTGTVGAIALLKQLHLDVTGSIPAGSALIGKVGIDQTTPGTTNGVQINAALPAGANIMGKVGIDQTTPGTTNGVSQQAFAAGGWSSKWFVAANSDNATNLKNAAGVVHSIHIYGIGSTPAWLKFYDKASSPTCNSDTVVAQYLIPANSVAANGAGNNATIIDKQFSTGISYCVVTGIAASDDTSVAAATFVVNIGYK